MGPYDDMRKYNNPAQCWSTVFTHYTAMSTYRTARKSHLDAYQGNWHGPNASMFSVSDKASVARSPLNLLSQALHALYPAIAFNNPKFAPRPVNAMLQIEALKIKYLIDERARALQIARNVYRKMIAEAFFSPFGVSYTGVRTGKNSISVDGLQFDQAEPFVEAIDFDDTATDQTAKRFTQRTWDAHKFTAPRHLALECGYFPGKEDLLLRLPAIEDAGRQEPGNGGVSSALVNPQRMFDNIELWNVCVYDGGKIIEIVMPAIDTGEFLMIQEYEGPEGGPYDHLWFNHLPGSVMPKPIAADYRDICEAAEAMVTKLTRAALRARNVVAYSAGNEDDALAVKEAEDNGTVKVADPKGLNNMQFGAMIPDVFKAAEMLRAEGDKLTLTDLLTGAEGQGDTATEANILNNRAGARIADARAQVNAVAAEHGRKMAYYFQTDPAANYPTPIKVGGQDIELTYSANNRQGRPEDFAFEVDVESMGASTPRQQVKNITDCIDAIGRNVPLVQIGFNPAKFTRVIGRLSSAPELDEIFDDAQLSMQNAQAMQGAAAWKSRAAGGPGTSPELNTPGAMANDALQ